jgi:hypothetical protein
MKESKLKTQEQAIIHFFSHMDIEMLDEFLELEQYQDMPKAKFLGLLNDAFCKCDEAGDSHLIKYPGACNGCAENKGCTGFAFLGNKTGNYLNMVIKTKDDRVIDLFECSSFKSDTPEKKGRKVWIDDIFGNNEDLNSH